MADYFLAEAGRRKLDKLRTTDVEKLVRDFPNTTIAYMLTHHSEPKYVTPKDLLDQGHKTVPQQLKLN